MRVSSDVISRTVDGEEALLDLSTQKYFGLNAAGTLIWKLLGDGRPVEEIAKSISREFDVDEKTARADAEALIGELAARGLVR